MALMTASQASAPTVEVLAGEHGAAAGLGAHLDCHRAAERREARDERNV